MSRSKKTVRLTVSLDEAEYAAVSAIAERNDASMSWALRQALHQFIKNNHVDIQSAEAIARPLQPKDPLVN
ncbi:ribbon-helix-helix domain-containing protein [Rhizobium leguminosarum]|uniref:ribbon-helix-helix domain-containing protein n=1 Tax=Rhizobium leguminosarum TaxID=384 RepID=UPI0013F178D5|nr:ribbon-helix-helix domain-containing protein [Rhizobium leguminosarum]